MSQSHEQQASEQIDHPIRCAVLTVSDTRTLENDTSGELIVRHLADASHHLAARVIVQDEPQQIREALTGWINDPEIEVILATGGTGISRRDTTVEVVRSLLTHELDGFGELFRRISFDQIGAAAMLSRAIGGLVIREHKSGDTLIFAMPGSTNAVETAMSKLIIPQIKHLVWERRR